MVRYLTIVIMLRSATALGAGWTQVEGEHYLKVWSRTLVGSAGHATDERLVDLGGTFVDTSLHLYGEYGLSDNLTVVAGGTPFGWAGFEGNEQVYIGALRAGLRYGSTLGAARLAVEGRYGFAPPVGDDAIAGGMAEGTSYVYKPTVTTHMADLELQAGYPLPFGWTSAVVGARWFSRDAFDPALYGLLQVGLSTQIGIVADLHVQFHQPLGDIEVNNFSGAGETRYIGYGLSLAYWFSERWSVVAAFEGAAAIRANAASPSLIFGIEHK